MLFTDTKIQEHRGTQAVQRLRKLKLKNGHPFMINSKDLPPNQCYLEYPDGKVHLVSISSVTSRNLKILRELSSTESQILRLKFHLH